MKEVLAYPRVSGLTQIEGEGLPRQREAISRFCESRQWKVKKFFEEGGVSGTTDHESRVQWNALLRYAEESNIKTVVIEAAQRLARDLIVSELLLRDAAKRGIEIWDASLGEEIAIAPSDNPSRIFVRQIFAAVNQLDRALMCARLYDGKVRTDRWGGPPKVFHPDSPVVKHILELHDMEATVNDIRHRLNADQKFFRPLKKEWDNQIIINILNENGRGVSKPRKVYMTRSPKKSKQPALVLCQDPRFQTQPEPI